MLPIGFVKFVSSSATHYQLYKKQLSVLTHLDFMVEKDVWHLGDLPVAWEHAQEVNLL